MRWTDEEIEKELLIDKEKKEGLARIAYAERAYDEWKQEGRHKKEKPCVSGQTKTSR